MIKFSVRGVEKLKAFFAKLPAAARKIAAPAVAEYIIGNESHGLKHYHAYKHIARADVYSPIFKSDKQRAYVMASIRSGAIKVGENRHGNLRDGWKQNPQGGGYGARIYNAVPYAQYVQGDGSQSRIHKAMGWRTMMAVVNTNIKGAMKKAEQAVQDWIQKNSK